MARIRYLDYLSAHRALTNEVSVNLITPLPEFDEDGQPVPVNVAVLA